MVAPESAGEIAVGPLGGDELYRPTNLSDLSFSTTADLQPIDGLVGQTRALEAIQFGTKVERAGFNLFVIGPNGARMQDAVKAVLIEGARRKPIPSDWVYVNNFADPDRPIAMELPGGRARTFHEAMRKLIDDLKAALPAVFQSEDYQTRRGAIDEIVPEETGRGIYGIAQQGSRKRSRAVTHPIGFRLGPGQRRSGGSAG